MKTTTHKWHLSWEKGVEDALRKVSSKDRMRLFKSLEQLLQADNPCSVLGVEKLKASECTWKFRQGDYRVFFNIESVAFRIYKGELILTNIALHHTGY